MTDPNIYQLIGEIKATAQAAHKRLDTTESEFKDTLKELNKKLDILNEHMNKGKGWSAALLFLSSIMGAGAFSGISKLLGK